MRGDMRGWSCSGLLNLGGLGSISELPAGAIGRTLLSRWSFLSLAVAQLRKRCCCITRERLGTVGFELVARPSEGRSVGPRCLRRLHRQRTGIRGWRDRGRRNNLASAFDCGNSPPRRNLFLLELQRLEAQRPRIFDLVERLLRLAVSGVVICPTSAFSGERAATGCVDWLEPGAVGQRVHAAPLMNAPREPCSRALSALTARKL